MKYSSSSDTLVLMVHTLLEKIVFGLKFLAVVVLFFAFSAMVRPQIGRYIIPSLVNLSQTFARSQEGVELDPIFLSDGMQAGLPVTGLYSTRHGYLGASMYGELVTSDTRVVAINRFLVDHGSPMAPYAETFVAAADDSGLDWRLIVSIAGVESAFGRLIPYNSYNAWGWRGGPGGDFSNFTSWIDGIQYVTSQVAEGYGRDIDVFTMEPIYCPPCGENPQHAWANGVTNYMQQLSSYRSNL